MVLIGGVLTTASLAPCRQRPDAERGGRLGARPVRGQPAVLSDRGLHHATVAGLPARRPGLPGCDADRGADRGGGSVAPAGRPVAGPAGPGRDHPHRAGQHDDPAAAAAGADLPAREHRRDRARRQPSPAGRGPGHRGSRHDRQPSSPRVLLPVIAGRRGCALRRLYALRGDVADNEAVLAAARTVLRRYRPDPDRQPHLVARIDDPRHADHWRGWHIGRSSRWFEDALSAHESTASGLLDQVFRTGARQLLLCGDSTLALAILRELARRAWERRQLAAAAASVNGTGTATADTADRARVDQQLLAPPPMRTWSCWTAGPQISAANTSRPARLPWSARCAK